MTKVFHVNKVCELPFLQQMKVCFNALNLCYDVPMNKTDSIFPPPLHKPPPPPPPLYFSIKNVFFDNLFFSILLGIRQPTQNIPSHLPRSLEDILLSVQFISTQNVWLHLIKMLTMSGDHWWLILHVPETVLVDNILHFFKPIPTHCNSFAGNVSRMWLNIHSAWAQDLGQLAEAWWMTSIWRSNRKVVIQCI